MLTTAVTGAGVAISQERTFGSAIDDATIWSEIKHLYLQKDAQDLLANVKIKVIEGRVFLTGGVKTPQTRIHAVKLAWQPRGVREVVNEIQIINEKKLKSFLGDKWIRSGVKRRLLFAKDVRSLNYSIEVTEGVVYVLGIARDKKELNTVLTLARTTKGVKKVVSHARLRHNPKRMY